MASFPPFGPPCWPVWGYVRSKFQVLRKFSRKRLRKVKRVSHVFWRFSKHYFFVSDLDNEKMKFLTSKNVQRLRGSCERTVSNMFFTFHETRITCSERFQRRPRRRGHGPKRSASWAGLAWSRSRRRQDGVRASPRTLEGGAMTSQTSWLVSLVIVHRPRDIVYNGLICMPLEI